MPRHLDCGLVPKDGCQCERGDGDKGRSEYDRKKVGDHQILGRMMIGCISIDDGVCVMAFVNVSIKKRHRVEKTMRRIMPQVKYEFVGKAGWEKEKDVFPKGGLLSGQCDGDEIGQRFNSVGS
jgi:hypothetical protein